MLTLYLHGQTVCSCSTQNVKKSHCLEPTRTHTWGGGGSSGHLRAHQPAHPFVQDPAMPPLPPPNTLAQLEEARRRLEEVSKPSKQRYEFQTLRSCMSVLVKSSQLMSVLTYGFHFTGIQHQAFRETKVTQCLCRMAVQRFKWTSKYLSS